MTKSEILQLKIVLKDVRPPIWRSLLIPADENFFTLHVTIQDAMGWTDSHLHQFFTAEPYKRNNDFQCIGFPVPEMEDLMDSRRISLSRFFKKPKDRIWYEYDFGDGWMHEIILEKIMPRDPNIKYPYLLDGANACPPEDCGGIGGYEHLLDVLANPKDEEYDDMREWLGIDASKVFDPIHFDKKDVKFRDPKKVEKRYQKGFRVE